MKKTVSIIAAICFFSFLYAQPSGSQNSANRGKHESIEQRAQKSVDRLDKIVTLTPEQKQQVLDLGLTRAKNVDEIRNKYKGQPEKKEDLKKEVQEIHKVYRLGVRKLLTAEQINKLKEYHKAKKAPEKGNEPENDLPSDKD